MPANMPIETQVAVLREQMGFLKDELAEVKSDVKQIKVMLTERFVTKEEFDNYKASSKIQKWFVGLTTALVTVIISYEIMQFISLK